MKDTFFEIRIIQSFRKKENFFFHLHFKNFIVTKSSKDASLVNVYYTIRAELFSGSIKETRSNGIKLNSSKLRNSSGSCNFFYYLFYCSNLKYFFFNLDLLNNPLFFIDNLKKTKNKRAVKRTSKFSK